jgi:hypothetical protein
VISEAVKQAVRALENDEGNVEPEEVVARARDPASPLHSHFEWDDAAAAHRDRLQTARRLIGSVRMSVTYEKIPLDGVRYVRSPISNTAFVNLHRVRNNEEVAREIMLEELAKLKRAARRCRSVATYFGVASEVTALNDLADEILAAIQRPLDVPEKV